MALNKLYYVYGLDTACLYTDEENEIEQRLIKARCLLAKLKCKLPKRPRDKKGDKYKEWQLKRQEWKDKYKYRLSVLYKARTILKDELKQKISNNKGILRTVRQDKILNKNGEPAIKRKVSMFDGNLTRCFGLKEREFNEEIVIIKVYFFDIAENIVNNGFLMNGYKYKFFSASAGQIRTKKLVAVREDLLDANWNTLTAGLTIEKINSMGGMNINKFLAYLALCNSATDVWENFDIDRCIVVEDFENNVYGEVDFIDDKTYQIERKKMDININHTDGCGMILPCLSKVNFMVRPPWIKGLMASYDFVKFIKDNNANPVVKDIYGDSHNIISENIQIIFTKSQFKMWKFYKNWEEYKENFKKYNCTAGKCNVEEEFTDSVINYQMIQTLSDMTDEEITELAKENNNDLTNLATDYKTMLKVFGAGDNNYCKSGFQKCLNKYPELLSDLYSRQTLKDLKKSLEKELWSARFKIGGKYTFVIPDLYAVCEWLFLHIQNPKGMLKSNEVCCKLFENNVKLDCLRSPSLYREHPVRVNNTNCEWFNTNAIYVSCHDLISKILQFDSDGDKLLVTDNKTLIKVAERNMQGIVPLYYNMSKASAELITSPNLYKGLKLAYNGGNIGTPSNDITKIWNSGDITQEQLNVVKWLCLEVNFTIDYAKTLYKPTRPDDVNKVITKYTKSKVPYFFQYAKDKKREQVENASKCCVDRIHKLYPIKKIGYNFKSDNIGVFDFRFLMSNPNIELNEEIVDRYKEVTSKLNFNKIKDDKSLYTYNAVYEQAKKDIVCQDDILEVVDNIILSIFYLNKTKSKKAFWTLFGNVVYKNLTNNLSENYVNCERCHRRYYRIRTNQKYCEKCQGYQKQKTKTVICCDCGTEFEVSSKNTKTIRCSNCQHEKTKKVKRKYWKKNEY